MQERNLLLNGAMNAPMPTDSFQTHCKHWRRLRKLSQLELALEAKVSQRHISWLETGRSQPSRSMIIRLADALDVPLRERNCWLQAAGFAPLYKERRIEAPDMERIKGILDQMLSFHEPFPAIVMDRYWTIVQMNLAAERLFGLYEAPPELIDELGHRASNNLAAMTLHPLGFRPLITNWAKFAPIFGRRLKQEMIGSNEAELKIHHQKLLALLEDEDLEYGGREELLPVLPLELKRDDLELSLISVMSTFGTPQDLTTDELRIECFYPADDSTEAFFRAVAAQ